MATLISPGTPNPALALPANSGITALASNLTSSNPAVWGASLYPGPGNLDSISLAPGLWCVTGLVFADNLAPSIYLNLASGTLANSWPVQQRTKLANYVYLISAVAKVSATTTVYLNCSGSLSNYVQGLLTATQIG